MARETPADAPATTVAIVTLGCARNEVDSDELAARLDEGGLRLVGDPGVADAVLVNTCGFIEQAKQESIDTLLDVGGAGSGPAVIAVGCMAERYGRELAQALPEASAVLGFDDYPDIADRVRAVLGGEQLTAHTPRDRRTLLPIAPTARPGHSRPPGHASAEPDLPTGAAPASGPRVVRRRLGSGPVAPVKLASGCDRRCSFCAIPAFRGSFVSRPGDEIVAELGWLADHGVREAFLVSENTTSYGKDLGDLRLLERLMPQMAAVEGIARIRLSYLQPAEMRPSLVRAIAETAGVAAYFDVSFQHASARVLRRMRRFGSRTEFLRLLDEVRAVAPQAGVRSNVIVGFPGESQDDLDELEAFLAEARLDAVGVFGYSPEDGTEAATFTDALDPDEVAVRVDRVAGLADELVSQRAQERVGERVDVLITHAGPVDRGTGRPTMVGLAEHQGPDVDGVTTVLVPEGARVRVGDMVSAEVVDSDGVDITARMRPSD
jgi:ribosomal protein S12 methylthiotransferase